MPSARTSHLMPSDVDPNIWEVQEKNGQWVVSCKICQDRKLRDLYSRTQHEQSSSHKKQLERIRRQQNQHDAQTHASTRTRTFEASLGSRPSGPAVPIRTTGDAASTRFWQSFLSPEVPRETVPHLSELDDWYQQVGHIPKPSVVDWEEMDRDYAEQLAREGTSADASPAYTSTSVLAERLLHYLEYGPDLIHSDDDEGPGEIPDPESPPSSDDEGETAFVGPAAKRTRRNANTPISKEWFPWDSRLSCTVDILMHLPRSAFSTRQMDLFLWLLDINGVPDVPSLDSMKTCNERLQKLFGIQTYRYLGSQGHLYYVNSLADQAAQIMSNPRMRTHLSTYPKDSGPNKLSQANEGARWTEEIPDEEMGPMVRIVRGQTFRDYYIFEPAMLRDGSVCMPHRWFVQEDKRSARKERYMGKCWKMEPVTREHGRRAWRVVKGEEIEVEEDQFLKPFPEIVRDAGQWHPDLIDVRLIEEVYDPSLETPTQPWTITNPVDGNPWRHKAKNHRCLLFPIWLYCDDTSGNTSKKWNEHNSFLFTAAGLSRDQVSKAYNIHFLCTSNRATPLEMLEGVVDQIEDAQTHGIWAWDSATDEPVLLLVCVLALLGDNPMQSEFACHIGLKGKRFCRACLVKGKDAAENAAAGLDVDEGNESDGEGIESDGEVESDQGSVSTSASRPGSPSGKPRKKGRAAETLESMIRRVKEFVKPGQPRNRDDSIQKLSAQFDTAKTLHAGNRLKQMQTESGLKDRYQMFFIDRLLNSYKSRRGTSTTKQNTLDAAIQTLPINTSSPVWRIRALNPNTDTPVEILHVVLLGFVKYLWRDVIKYQIKDNIDQKKELAARLSSVGIDGLGLESLLAGDTLVNYYGSLTGADFRKIAQVAPFVLHGMVMDKCYATWVQLSKLIPLIWQTEITDLPKYLKTLEDEIQNFLVLAADWSIRWFNKPKFHILVHLPDHIRRFGPAMLFATESFESYNAVIRAKSTHSNRLAPSRDIAFAFAQGDRIRHLLSGGKFLDRAVVDWGEAGEVARKRFDDLRLPQSQRITEVQWYFRNCEPKKEHWVTVGSGSVQVVETSRKTIARYLGLEDKVATVPNTCKFRKSDSLVSFEETQTGQHLPHEIQSLNLSDKTSKHLRTAQYVVLPNGDQCRPGSYAIGSFDSGLSVVRVCEVLQRVQQSIPLALQSEASGVLIEMLSVGPEASAHGMPRIQSRNPKTFAFVGSKTLLCTANVQHDCIRNKCKVLNTRVVRIEREDSELRKGEVHHAGKLDDMVLNTAQMRDAKYMQQFRVPPILLEVERTLEESAKREVEGRKKAKRARRPTNRATTATEPVSSRPPGTQAAVSPTPSHNATPRRSPNTFAVPASTPVMPNVPPILNMAWRSHAGGSGLPSGRSTWGAEALAGYPGSNRLQQEQAARNRHGAVYSQENARTTFLAQSQRPYSSPIPPNFATGPSSATHYAQTYPYSPNNSGLIDHRPRPTPAYRGAVPGRSSLLRHQWYEEERLEGNLSERSSFEEHGGAER
ncbi:hypothetical protein VNI00_008104 [Paramarasmius palmivorus]|uniref:Uncharacterized protein n=1 Tax=Paramarasmius palmivorus TaxID=297713 RepID=A0AAW0CV36_9AGAR